MTGANLLVASVAFYVPSGTPTASHISDSSGNTWVALTAKTAVSSCGEMLFYAKNAAVGASQTFTISKSGSYSSIVVMGFSGVDTTAPFDVENGTNWSGTTAQPGSITPSVDNELVISGCGDAAPTTTWTCNGNFSGTEIYYNQVPSTTEGNALAYEIQTTATARNPTWTLGTSGGGNVVIASFKETVASGQPYAKRAGGIPHMARNRGVW